LLHRCRAIRRRRISGAAILAVLLLSAALQRAGLGQPLALAFAPIPTHPVPREGDRG